MSDPTPSETKAASNSLGDLLGEVSRDLSTLMRQELALARAELRETATKSAKGAGIMGAAGSAALMAVIWAIVALILFVVGRSQLKQVEGMPQTVDTVKEIPEALKRNEENR